MRNFMIMIAMFFIKMYLKLVDQARTIFLDFNSCIGDQNLFSPHVTSG